MCLTSTFLSMITIAAECNKLAVRAETSGKGYKVGGPLRPRRGARGLIGLGVSSEEIPQTSKQEEPYPPRAGTAKSAATDQR